MRKVSKKLLSYLLALATVVTFSLSGMAPKITAQAEEPLTIVQPVVAVTGDGIIGGGTYTADNVTGETSYTLDELKALNTSDYTYSTINTSSTLSVFTGQGVALKALLSASGFTAWDTTKVSLAAPDGYTTSFDPAKTELTGNTDAKNSLHLGTDRYFFPNFNQSPASEDGKEAVETIIAWAMGGERGNAGSMDAPQPYEVSPAQPIAKGQLRVMTGQVTPTDVSNPLFNGDAEGFSVLAGSAVAGTALTIGTKEYTRADVLMMPRADCIYTYGTSGGDATDFVRGVPMSVLLDGYPDDAVVSFEAADGYDVAVSGYTVKQLIDNDYMLGYEIGSSADTLQGIYETAKKDTSKFGFFRLYGSDENGKPAKLVNKITVTDPSGTDYSTSPYKHITHDGAPYNIDSITGATLTVEGPGVKKSVPVSVRDLEGRDAGIKRADYTDKREGSNITRKYEGVELYYILNGMTSGDSGIQMTDTAEIVQIKNRNRKTIAQFTVDQINAAHETATPILVAYGTSYTDGTGVSPFVFDNGNGADKTLGNEDGCMKLVYDKSVITGDVNTDYNTFGNMAYIYVAEAAAPGYKHDKDPYQSADISNYVLTVTGDKIGREVNYTVKQLEDMVAYGEDGAPDNTGMGYRDEYSLANSTYWYVNEYEGVQLWKLLLKSGLDPAFANDEETIVSSTATDGYPSTDKFTTKQVADPDSFGFYEKNPADLNDGSYTGDESIRQYNDDGSYTGDKLRTGYPVLVAYGVNGYPYVEKASQDGYLSGLQNDGGPLRIISGKIQYSHPNGSNQAKFLDKVLVGSDTYHYSTHKYNSDATYTAMADQELSVRILNGSGEDAPEIKSAAYKIGDLEELLYGGSLTSAQIKEAKVKTFYQLAKGSSLYSDLYEGVNLNYFLKNVVEIPGYKGTITFSNGTDSLSLNLADVLATSNGSNTETNMTGLAPILAYGKNGSPMVLDKNADGYVKEVTLAEGTEYENKVTVKNDGGPLAVLFPHTDTDVSEKSLTNVTSITINLSADKYAHTNAPYDAYKDNPVKIFGEGTRLGTEGKDFAISELEGKQTIAFTGDYSLRNKSGDVTQQRFRGIDLYALLTSPAVGLKSNADKVIFKDGTGDAYELTLSQVRKNNYINSVTGAGDLPVILAYGASSVENTDPEDGLPLVPKNSTEEQGYNAAYGNDDGPIRLVIGQTDAEDTNKPNCRRDIVSIEVTATELDSWNHSVSEVFKQYLNETLNLTVVDKDGNELFNKTYTVGEIEANTSLVERADVITTQRDTWEGINFWKWVKQEVGTAADITDPINIDVTAADGYSQEIRSKFSMDEFNNGRKDGETYVPILIGYGVNGYPLAIGDKTYPNGEGYDATAGNNGGPLRLLTHMSQGTCLTYLKKVKITVGENTPQPAADFTIKGLEGGDIGMTIDDIKALKNKAGDAIGQAEGQYTTKGVTKKVKGALLKNILAAKGVEVETTGITLHTPDGFEDKPKGASYKDITLKQAVAQQYFLAYQEWDETAGAWVDIADTVKGTETVTKLRMYRNYCEANGLSNADEWYDECTNIVAITVDVPEITKFKEYPTNGIVRSTAMDSQGNLWAGTFGAGLHEKKSGAQVWDSILGKTSDPALFSDYTDGVAIDSEDGIWITQNDAGNSYQDATGVIYYKDGVMTHYTAEDGTVGDNYVQFIEIGPDGKVWFSSMYSGVTAYDPQAKTWTTYTKEKNGFPATSVNPIEPDADGGVWLGFYPEGPTDGVYTGGFCHMNKDGSVDYSKVLTGDQFSSLWVRDFEIDSKGRVWVICGGSNMEGNVGGMVYILDGDNLTSYTGKSLFGDVLGDGELRLLTIDPAGAFWFGTYSGGVLKVDDPTVADGKMTVSAQYSKGTGSWSEAPMDNVYSIDFYNNGTAYVGSAGGVQVLGMEPGEKTELEKAVDAATEDLQKYPVEDEYTLDGKSEIKSLIDQAIEQLKAATSIEEVEAAAAQAKAAIDAVEKKPSTGGATYDTADLKIVGDGTAQNGYFSIKSLKNAEGVAKVTANVAWQNSSGTTGVNTFEGVYVDNLLKDVIGLDNAPTTVVFISADGRETTLDLSKIEETDLAGTKPMLAWQSDEETPGTLGKINLKLVIGQYSEGEVNKSKWGKDIVAIRVNSKPMLSQASISPIKAVVYKAAYHKPNPVVTYDGRQLVKGTDYTVSYKNNKNAGKATVTVTGTGEYAGSKSATFTIKKAAQKMTVKAKKKTVRLTRVKAKKQIVRSLVIKKAKGRKVFKKLSRSSKRLTVNKKTGKITVKKGTKKGTYKIRIKVTAKGTSNYLAKSKTVTARIVVR